MKLTVEVNLDNDTFDPVNGVEVSRILAGLAERLWNECLVPSPVCESIVKAPLYDVNGNNCGRWFITP